MKKIVKLSLATAMLMSMGAVSAQAEDVKSDGMSILDGVYLKGEIRPRFEMVDADNANKDAKAYTNRLVLGAGSDKLFGTDMLGAYLEITDVHSLNSDYDDKGNNLNNGYQVVGDPEQTRLTQSYIDIKPIDGLLIRYGRQMINLGDQRFVGAVGWRQMPQTYDATLLSYSPTKEINLSTVYATAVNRIWDENNAGGDRLNTKTSLTNLSYRTKGLDVTGYAYLVGSHSDTYGAYVKGSLGDDIKISYRAEYAIQTDASLDADGGGADAKLVNGKPDCDSDYIHLSLGANISGLLLNGSYMVQSADDKDSSKAFETPLGTNHKYGGWADKFLTTPANGLEDMSVMAGYKSKAFGTLKVVYHDFQSETGSIDYGTEVDAVYVRAIPGVKGLKGMLKFADYHADDFSVDTTKFWAMLDYKFSTK